MTTTSITSGTDFIGKTLVIGSTALIYDNPIWARIFDFNDGTSSTYIIAPFRANTGYLRFTVHPFNSNWITQEYTNYIPLINKYYIYTISFLSLTELKVNVYEYDTSTGLVSDKGTTIKTITMPNTVLPSITNFWLGRSVYTNDHFYNGRYDKVALYNGDLLALSEANVLSTLLTLVTSTQTNIINNSTTYTFRALGTNFLGVVVNILNYNTTTGSNVDISGITLIGNGTTSGGYLNIIGSYIEPPHNLNTPNKQWLMYLNTLSSISGDDLTIKPDTRRNLLLEVSGNNNIFIKKGDTSYNLTNLITGDASFSNVDVSVNLNPLQTNSNIGLPSKVWRNAYIRDISVTNISISGNMTIYGSISNVIQTIPKLNDISSSLGSATYIWQRAFIRDLSSISTTNGTNWPVAGPTGLTGPLGPTGGIGAAGPVGPTGPQGLAGALGVSLNATLTDISNFRITNNRRIYQNICGDISWSAVNGYYGLAKDAYPSLNQQSSGVLAVKTWTSRSATANNEWQGVCWSPELRLFVAVSQYGSNNKVMTSSDGINWISRTSAGGFGSYWQCVCWSPQLRLFVALCFVNNLTSDVRAMFSSDGVSWSPATSAPEPNNWRDVCWSPELGLFLAVANGGSGTNRIAISSNGKDWTGIVPSGIQAGWFRCCWSPQLRIFLVIGLNPLAVIISSNGTIWSPGSISNRNWSTVCWSPELGIFLAVTAGTPIHVTTSSNGITWTEIFIRTTANIIATSCCWSSQLGLFVAVFRDKSFLMYSHNGINWTFIETGITNGGTGRSICWSPELGIFVSVNELGGTQSVMTSSLKGRPPTSYNVFDSSFNRINENGIWDFSNINVTTLYVNNVYIESDDRLKHNEIVITNGLDVIDRLTPKFYQKTQVLLDASYNGDLSGHAWTYEAGLIAQEVLQISDLSYVVGGGDYYEQKYNLITQTQNNDLSANYYEVSNNYYELSNNYYEPSANNYEVINNLIIQAYNLNYNSVFVYGLAAIKELHAKVKAKEISILQRQTIINNLITRIETLESARQDVSNNIL